ncbi:MAG: DUF3426 domain-containing protein [Alphaproteobacteria bacterium]
MILTCPRCSTRYLADASLFTPPGRNVRCAKCGHVWLQAPAGPESEPEPEPSVAERAAAEAIEPATPAAHRQRRLGSALAGVAGWAVLILLVLAAGAAGVKYRETIASFWPQTATLYAAIGMPVNLRGLEFSRVRYEDHAENGEPVLAITGELVNITSRTLPVPPIRVALSDGARRELYHWTFQAGVQTLAPGGRSAFMTRLANPPREARNVDIGFARDGE